MNNNNKKLSAVLCVLVLSFSVWAADTSSAKNAANTDSQTTEQNAADSITLTTDQTQVPIPAAPAESNVEIKQPSTVWLFVRMILVLAVVIACIYGIVYLMKRGMKPGAENDPFLRKVSQITLSPGKTVQVVTLLDHAYVIGVTDNAVNLIGTVDDKELVDSMNLYADKNTNTKKPRSFADVLDIFMPNGPRDKTKTVFGESARSAAENLKKQRDRLHEEHEESGSENNSGEQK